MLNQLIATQAEEISVVRFIITYFWRSEEQFYKKWVWNRENKIIHTHYIYIWNYFYVSGFNVKNELLINLKV